MKVFYAGSFDPFTIGHFYIANKALEMFDSVIIGIGYNEAKHSEYPIEKRLSDIKKAFGNNPRVTVLGYDGLTAVVAKENGAGALVRGVRNTIDFEKEKELADINLEVFGIPTVMIPTKPSLSYISSSMVRELTHFGFDAQRYIEKEHSIDNKKNI